MPKEPSKKLIVSYGDPLSLILLWQKAFLMMPLWAIPIIVAVGFVSRFLGVPFMEFSFALVICGVVAYFLEDLLKRKIVIDDQFLFFGFRAIPIKQLISVELASKKNKLLPSALMLTNNDGKQFRFKLEGLSDKSIEAMIGHLKGHNSQLKTSPLLQALVKSKHVAALPLAVPEKFEITYNTRPILTESIAVYKESARQWMRVGPLLAAILMGPTWVGAIYLVFFSLTPHTNTGYTQLALQTFLTEFTKALAHFFYGALASISTSVANASQNVWAMSSMGLVLAVVLFQTQRVLLRPNRVRLDAKGVTLTNRLGFVSLPVKNVFWSNIEKIELKEGQNNSSKIVLGQKSEKIFEINLAAIPSEMKNVLLKRIEEAVPACPIEHEVTQSLLPQSDHSYTELWLQSLNETPERKTLDPLEPGQLVGGDRYEVLHGLGVGGQGTAYLCRDLAGKESNNLVVLKETILPVFVDSQISRRSLESFDQEARLLKSLGHPNIVQLQDFFVEDHRAYLVLEHATGRNLRDIILTEGPMAESLVLPLAEQMCEMLQFLHGREVIHRDFTPDNLILDEGGKLKLIDFNVAQQLQAGSQGTIVGKPAYMPPEQFRGKATTGSDIYAMGATLYFMLTGLDPDPISQSSPRAQKNEIGSEIDAIVQKATRLDTKSRYQRAEDVLAELNSSAVLLDDKSVVA